LSISNKESCKFYGQFGDRVVLARELTLPMIEELITAIKQEEIRGKSGNLLEVEIFIHGAMCVAVSGRCWMSLYTHNSSANRGACKQNCRKPYTVIDQETGKALDVDNEYIMSPEDLCTIDFLDQVVATGVKSLKIEGRGRSPEYVSTVIRVYREALTAIATKTYTPEAISLWKKDLESVYNRGLSDGYFFGRHQEHWSKQPGSKATYEKFFVGTIRKYYAKAEVCEVLLQDNSLQQEDRYSIVGPTTGVQMGVAEEMQFHEEHGEKLITLKVAERVRRGDKLFVLRERN